MNIAAVFLAENRVCCIKNTRKVFNLNHIFALYIQFLPQKTASQINCQQILTA